MAAISDGVFAVALTLLVLDIKPPEGGASALVSALVAIAPQLGIFALSFAIVSYYWDEDAKSILNRTTNSMAALALVQARTIADAQWKRFIS